MIDKNGLFRIAPRRPVGAYKTYQVAAPLGTHWRKATCEEVECEAYQFGWITKIDTATELGMRQCNYIIKLSGREYTLEKENTIAIFTFTPGQQCFQPHQAPLERDPLLIVRDGDWRGNPSGYRRVHKRVEDWVDDFVTHQSTLAKEIDRG